MTYDAETKMQFLFTLRSRGVTEHRVLEAMEKVDRGLFVQGLFAYIVNIELTASKYTDASARRARAWRMNIGHSPEFFDEILGQSLVARVCNADAGLELSTVQSTSFKEIQDFWPMGTQFCSVCCFVWYEQCMCSHFSSVHVKFLTKSPAMAGG